MKIKKGTLIEVNHCRKGRFLGIAREDFDTEETEFYPINVAQDKGIEGIGTQDALGLRQRIWELGEKIPCRNSLCTLKPIAK